MKKIILIILIFCTRVYSQSLENDVIIFKISTKYGKEVVSSYFLLEPISNNTIDSKRTIFIKKKKYEIKHFEIPIFENALKSCCLDSLHKNTFINGDGEPNYSLIFKEKNQLIKNKNQFIFTKIRLRYCECSSPYFRKEENINNTICYPDKVLKHYNFSKSEKSEFENKIESLYKNLLVKQIHFGK